MAGLLKDTGIDLKDKVVLDAGASTGGFVQVALLAGASKVFAVDVGYGILDWTLRNDPRVVVMERTNARYLKKTDFSSCPEIGMLDLSFISLKKVLPVFFEIIEDSIIALMKPQFEASREEMAGTGGVVQDLEIHERLKEEFSCFPDNYGWICRGIYSSVIKGRKGNQEFFIHYEKIRA